MQTFRISVADLDGNNAPVFVQVQDRSINELEPISIQLVANDSDSAQNQLRYEALRSPVGSTLDPVTGLFTWTPNSAAGTRTFGIDVQVTDQTGLTDVQTFRITVADIEGGTAPVFVQVQDQSIDELEPISIQLVANDSDSAQSELRYEALRSPVGSTLDPVTGLFTWTPNSAAGTRTFGIDVQVTDQTGLSDVQTFRITVADVPQGEAPVFVQVEDRTINELEPVSIQLVATDSDSSQDQLRYTALRSPVGSVLDPLTGVFTWTPNSAAGTRTFGIDVQVTDETGASDTQTFRIEVLDISDEIDDIVLIETQEFETSATRSLTIDESTNELAFDFATIFDQGDTDFINDAFEVALLDSEGNSLVHTIDANRDAFFNVTEGEAAAGGVNTVVMGQTVRLDLSHIAEGTSADLVFRLVNNDDDTNTQVTISSIETSDNQLNTPVGAALGAAVAGPAAPIDFARLSDVTGSLEVNFGQTSFNDADDALYSRIELTNVGQVAIAGRILAVLENPTDVQVALLQPDGRLPDGRFFIEVNPEDGQLEAGDTTTSRDLVLQNPSEEQFDFDLTILAEVNNAPIGFTSTPPSIVEAGNTLTYTAVATDSDEGQTLRYNIVRGNEAITINEDTGELSWLTTSDNIGSNRITIRATDPLGLFTEQTFDVEVVETLQNRPPTFTTDPVTDATASSGFEITTIATGDNPNGVGVVSGFEGPRIVTINSDDQTVGVYAGTGNDRFDDETTFSTGEPERTGNAIQSGFNVDVGLPPFLNNTDVNDIFGLDQADFNGDGILDLASLTYHRSNVLRDGNFHNVVINLGDGDGGFGEPIIVEQFDFVGKAAFENFKVADINGDGTFDFVWLLSQCCVSVSGLLYSRLYTILGNADGTFQPSRCDQ